MKTRISITPPSSGFVLLEIILALALFATVGTAMTVAIHKMAEASRSSREEGQVLRALESAVAEVAHRADLAPETFSFKSGNSGVAGQTVVSPANLRSSQHAALDHLFLITVDAWMDDGTQRRMRRHLETYTYAPPIKGGLP